MLSFEELRIADGDHKIREESVEVDRSVGSAYSGEEGLHDRLVTPAS